MKKTDSVLLCENNFSMWSLVIGEDPTESEEFALEEFDSHFTGMCGVKLRRKTNKSPICDYEICIGTGKHTKDIEADVKLEGFENEEFSILISEKRIVIAGHPGRGTLYGVYEFLEEELGIRWYTPDLTHIPKKNTVYVEKKQYSFKPALEYRETLCVHYDKEHPLWHIRNRLNCVNHDPRFGGSVEWKGFCHTFHDFVSPEEYFDSHPEYFAYREDLGRRVTGRRAQLCLSNPEVLDIVITKAKRLLRENPHASIISVSQMDGTKPGDILYCQCPKCKAKDELEQSQSGSLLHFVNQVADGIRDEFPYASVDTIAYAYTTKPPKYEKARPNVIVRPCFGGALLDEWYKVCNRLYIWDYVTNFRHYSIPFPNYDLISGHIAELMSHKVKGIFIQSTYDTKGCDFNELKCYLYAKVLWHPEKNIMPIMDEFMASFFETSAPAMTEYLNLLRERIRTAGIAPACFVNLPVFYLDADLLHKADALFDRAEKLAPSQKVLERVMRMRMSVRFVELMYMDKDDPRRNEMIDEYFVDLARLGIDRISERNELPEAKQRMKEFSGLYELADSAYNGSYAPEQI